uniref:RRM domain-containing protein n=1 Tax=Oryza rufipogon TaxID=4529 RepID=A0A0E0NBU7_ORYRU
MAGYPEENQHRMNGYEEEEEVEEVEGFDEEGRPGRRGGGGRDGGDGGAYGDASGDDGRAPGGDSSGKIFVGGVAWETTEESFSKHFEKYGAITDSVIMKDKHTKMPRGFGFVTFSDPSVIDKVLEDEHVIDGRTVEVKRTVPREEMSSKDGPKTRKIFVGGLPSSLTEDELREHFSPYGKIVEHQIMLDHSTGRSRGFGFVTFESEDSVERVISEGRMRDLGGKQVEIKKAEPKKHGGDHSSNGRSSHGSGGGYRSSYRSGGAAASGGGGGGGGGGSGSSGGYGYGAGYRSAGGEEGMAMEVMLDLDQDMVVVMVAPCMEVPMVLMGHMVVVPMEGVPMAEVLMVVVPMVALRVPMVVLEDMAVMVELEQEVLVGGVPAGTIHMGNE